MNEDAFRIRLHSHLDMVKMYSFSSFYTLISHHFTLWFLSRSTKGYEDVLPPGEEIEFKATETHNLQKTVSGGILLLELSFRQEYFCVNLFTCDHNKLGITVNQQVHWKNNLKEESERGESERVLSAIKYRNW